MTTVPSGRSSITTFCCFAIMAAARIWAGFHVVFSFIGKLCCYFARNAAKHTKYHPPTVIIAMAARTRMIAVT